MPKKLLYILFILTIAVFMPDVSFAQSTHLCTNPSYYDLTASEVNISNREFYCWEIKYLKDYQKRLSMDLNSYLALYPQPLFVRDVNVLREAGITPEKAEYLTKYFADIPLPANKSDTKILNTALSQAESHIKNVLPYRIGIPVGRIGILGMPNITLRRTAYKSVLKIFSIGDCIPFTSNTSFDRYLKKAYPKALRPVGVLGTTFINMFGEVVGQIKDTNTPEDIIAPFDNDGNKPVYLYNTNTKVTEWDSKSCNLSNLMYELKDSKSCISCHIFEVCFNTISRIGYVIYDTLAYYSISLMVGLFLFWMLFVFFDNVIKKQDGMTFVKTFFQKALWVFIIGFALTVPVSDKYNILNYTIVPLTDFMVGYNKVLTSGIETEDYPFQCKYATKNINDSRVIFSGEIRKNIVCTIERISAFNNMNYDIGKYNMKTGFNQVINLDFSGFTKIIVGFCIMAIFFYINIMVPFYFIESFFMIATVLFVFPLILVAYALDKTQFVKESFNTFLSAIFQVISLTLMCAVISLLMLYISGIDFYSLQQAMDNNDLKEVISQTLYMISFTPNTLLEVFYTGFLCWFLLGEALTIANKYNSMVSGGNVAQTFIKWTKSIVNHTTQITREAVSLKFDSKDIADKINNKIANVKDKIKTKKSSSATNQKNKSNDEGKDNVE